MANRPRENIENLIIALLAEDNEVEARRVERNVWGLERRALSAVSRQRPDVVGCVIAEAGSEDATMECRLCTKLCP